MGTDGLARRAAPQGASAPAGPGGEASPDPATRPAATPPAGLAGGTHVPASSSSGPNLGDLSRAELEAELTALRARFTMVAENASDVVFSGSNHGVITWMTEGVTRLAGWRPQDVVGRRFIEMVHPDDRDQVVASQEVILSGRGASFEARMRTGAGGYRWVGLLVRPVFDDEGRLVGRVGSGRDIEVERAARVALARSEAQFRTLMDASAAGMCVVAPDGTYLRVNRALCEFLGRRREELLTRTWQELTHPDDVAADLALADEVLRGERDSYRLTKRYLRPGGRVVWGDVSVSCVRGEDGRVEHLVSQVVDITEAHLAGRAIEAAERQLRMLAENASDLVFRADDDRRLLWVSPSVADTLGWSVDELLGTRITDLMKPAQASAFAQDRGATAGPRFDPTPGDGYMVELRSKRGDYRWFSGRIRPVRDEDDHPDGIVAGLRDVTDLVLARRAAEEREARRRAILETLLDPHVLLRAVRDADGRICDFVYADANGAACEYMQMTRGQLVGARLLDILPGQSGSGMLELYAQALESGEPLVLDDFAYPHEIVGSERRYDIRAVAVDDALSFTWRDVTERHAAAEALNERARHDQLTGLLNRGAVFEEITTILGQQPRTGHRTAVAFCDLDKFKELNDTHGHRLGDTVLRTFSEHMREMLRSTDVVARLGGDEFLLVLRGIHDLAGAAAVAEKVRQHCSEPHEYEGIGYAPMVSIGVTLLREGEDADELIARADRAMYEAKRLGGNCVVAV